MEVYELRRRNLTRILDEAGPGARQRLALRLNMTPPMVSHWLREPGKPRARKIHEASARQIEQALGLLPGTLDTDPTAPRDLSPQEELMLECMAAVTRAVEDYRKRATREDILRLSRAAYQHAVDNGRLDEKFVAERVRYD